MLRAPTNQHLHVCPSCNLAVPSRSTRRFHSYSILSPECRMTSRPSISIITDRFTKFCHSSASIKNIENQTTFVMGDDKISDKAATAHFLDSAHIAVSGVIFAHCNNSFITDENADFKTTNGSLPVNKIKNPQVKIPLYCSHSVDRKS